MDPSRRRPVALVGLMGAGKSAVARILAERMGAVMVDLDDLLEAEEGRSILELFAREGEPYFRRREAEMLAQALDAGAGVLACGGGIVLDAANRARLRQRCRVVWLQVTPARAADRLGPEAMKRPLLQGAAAPAARLAEIRAARASHYREVAHQAIATDGLDAAQVADRIEAWIAGEAEAGR